MRSMRLWLYIPKPNLKVCKLNVSARFLSLCLSHPHPHTYWSRRTTPSSSMLTVSLPNAKSAPVAVWVNEPSHFFHSRWLYISLCLFSLLLSLLSLSLQSIRKTSNQTMRGGAVLRGRSSRGAGTSSPMGIPLQFNYRATTNQVSLAFQQSLYTQHGGRVLGNRAVKKIQISNIRRI